MNWIEITIRTTTFGVDAVTEILGTAGISGVIIQDPADIESLSSQKDQWDYVDESLGYNFSDVLVKGYLPDILSAQEDIKNIKYGLSRLLTQDFGIDFGPLTLDLTNVREEDWAHNWKRYFKPKKVGKYIVIKPSWEEYSPKGNDIILTLDPGMAFGTGTHETTIMCISALEEYINPNFRLLDVGTGTGILAIAGLLLGAKEALAIDLDLNATRIAKDNSVLNGVDHKMRVVHGNLLDKVNGKYDIVVSNIIADVIKGISPTVKSCLTHKGIFIASGIIHNRVRDVEASIKDAGLTLIDTKTMGEWAAMVAINE